MSDPVFSNLNGKVDEFRCCTDGVCENIDAEQVGECQGQVLEGPCESFGCPKSCCEEDDSGNVICTTVDEFTCPGIVDPEPCESACKGACCIDGQLVSESLMTQQQCESIGGCFQGVGTDQCSGLECRAPYDGNCCERVVSSAQSLTFTGPRKRRCPELPRCGALATVTIKTVVPVYVHGRLYQAGEVTDSFYLCNDEFVVTPAPCAGNLGGLDITVCWSPGVAGSDIIRFHCCEQTYLLGNCDCDCESILLYDEDGCTSSVTIQLLGDATIDASGTGPLVLTSNISSSSNCEKTLTLDGSNADGNELSGAIGDGGGTSIDKVGVGLWRLSGASSYSGKLRVLGGTLVIAANVGQTGASPIGIAIGDADLPEVGGFGETALFAAGGVTIGRGFKVMEGTSVVRIGMTGMGTAIFAGGMSIKLGRDVTLQAADGGTVVFSNTWQNLSGGSPAVAFNVGSAGNAGTVVFESFLPDSITEVNVRHGTLQLGPGGSVGDETIFNETPVVVWPGSTLDLNGTNQPLKSLLMIGPNAKVIGGTLETLDEMTSSDSSGSEISSDVVLGANTSVAVDGPLLFSGDVSGTGGLEKTGPGSLTLSGAISYTGQTSVTAGELILEQTFSDSPDITLVTFTDQTLTVIFSVVPVSGATYQLLGGSTAQTYSQNDVILAGAAGGVATATYNSSTSTITVN